MDIPLFTREEFDETMLANGLPTSDFLYNDYRSFVVNKYAPVRGLQGRTPVSTCPGDINIERAIAKFGPPNMVPLRKIGELTTVEETTTEIFKVAA